MDTEKQAVPKDEKTVSLSASSIPDVEASSSYVIDPKAENSLVW
jgi:hypothetical protein